MKKRVKKLNLSRETLRHLENARIRHVVGGGNTAEIITGCACTETCDTNWSCGCNSANCNTNGCPGNTDEILSGCATNCG